MRQEDNTLENLLELDGERFVVDDQLGYWVKFEVKRTTITLERPHGVKYSLTLHDRHNKRIMGFDNAHAIEYGRKRNVAPKKLMIIFIKIILIMRSHIIILGLQN